MSDVLTPSQRSYCMSKIRGKDTKPEQIIRQGLFRRGFRFRLHRRDLPGKPDLTLAAYRAVIFVHGCLWHGHGCHLFKWPKTNEDFWRTKIERNMDADKRNQVQLRDLGWRIVTIWECSLRGSLRRDAESVIDDVAAWLTSERAMKTIRAKGRRS